MSQLKVTGHVGIYKATEDFMYLDMYIHKDSILCCGIVADYRVSGYLWKGWHLDKEDHDFHRNQLYLDWSKLERLTYGAT